jgi:hypothetical protein
MFSRDPVETVASELSITARVSTTVLSETHTGISRRGLTLFLVIRRGLWLDECLGVTECRAKRALRLPPNLRLGRLKNTE